MPRSLKSTGQYFAGAESQGNMMKRAKKWVCWLGWDTTYLHTAYSIQPACVRKANTSPKNDVSAMCCCEKWGRSSN